MVRANHPNNIKRGGVCAYVRESLPVRVVLNHHLSECLILEVNLKNKKGYLVSLYRSPNQNPDEFELFLTNLENVLADITNLNPHFMLLLGDFNAKSIWDETTNRRTNSCSRKLLKLYRYHFYEPVKFDNGCWSSSLTPFEMSPSCHIRQT